MKRIKKIIGERIYLSPINEGDCEQYARWLNDFEITDRLGMSDFVTTMKSEKEWLEDNLKKGNHVYGIILAETDEIIGNIGIESIRGTSRRADVGLFIGDEKYRNKGYGAEALRLACHYLLYKGAAKLSSAIAGGTFAGAAGGISGAFGMVMGAMGACTMMMFFSIISFVQAVN